MRACAQFFALLALCAAAPPPPTFDAWAAAAGRAYAPAERAHRAAIFAANAGLIAAHNARNDTWAMGFGPFADLTAAEFTASRTGGYVPRALRGGRAAAAHL